jgi:hypothetical protein
MEKGRGRRCHGHAAPKHASALNACFILKARVKCHGHAAPKYASALNAYFILKARVKGARGAAAVPYEGFFVAVFFKP